MNYNKETKQVEFIQSDIEIIGLLCATFKHLIELNPLGYYEKLSSENLWINIVEQFCVMGNANLLLKILSNPEKYKQFRDAISLSAVLSSKNDREYISDVLLKFKVTRFHNQQAEKLSRLLKTPDFIQGDRILLIDGLDHNSHFSVARNELMKQNPHFKMKSASDFMIELGFSHDVMAFDTRIVGFLRKHLSLNLTTEQIQGYPALYETVETSLRDVCKEFGIELAVLDRIIFKFSNFPAIDYVLEIKKG